MEREGIFAISISVAVGLLLAILWQSYGGSLPSTLKAEPTTQDVVEAFKREGLEAEEARPMTKDDYGFAPMKAKEGTRFFISSLGPDNGGRIMSFDNRADLQNTKQFYDKMGRETAMLFSWTFEHKNILVQINGDLPEDKARRYEAALKSL